MKLLFVAIFFSLFTVHAFGGEWHSAGNSPPIPYRPSGTVRLRCLLTGYTAVGSKTYRFDTEREISDQEFREPGRGAAIMTLQKTGDPGMDGQSLYLSFSKGQSGEILVLRLRAVSGTASANSEFLASRAGGEVRGDLDLNVQRPRRGQASWVRVKAECKLVE